MQIAKFRNTRSDRIALSAGFHWLSLLSLATYRRFIANPLLVFYVSNEVEREESDKSVFQRLYAQAHG